MKKVAVITPFYPIYHREDLYENTKAIHYLLQNPPKNIETLIVHSYMFDYKKSWVGLIKIILGKQAPNNHMHRDKYGHKVLFIINYLLIPKSLWISKRNNKNNIKIVEKLIYEEGINPDVISVHFPTYYLQFINDLNLNSRKIAIIHSFDIKNIKQRRNIDDWIEYFTKFDSIGFRSNIIKSQFEYLIGEFQNSFLVYSGIPKSYISISKNYNHSNSKRGGMKILYAGNIDKNKNLETVIYALQSVPFKFKYNIVGDGGNKNKIKKLANKVKINDKVEFKGHLSRDETFKEMLNSEIFIMVSKKETFGLVYLEAMAARCIVIATKNQGIDGVIKDGINGFLVESNAPDKLNKLLLRISEMSTKDLNFIKQNAFETACEFLENELSTSYYCNLMDTLKENKDEV